MVSIQAPRHDATARHTLAAWSVFYCGGSHAIRDELQQCAKGLGIGFQAELYRLVRPVAGLVVRARAQQRAPPQPATRVPACVGR